MLRILFVIFSQKIKQNLVFPFVYWDLTSLAMMESVFPSTRGVTMSLTVKITQMRTTVGQSSSTIRHDKASIHQYLVLFWNYIVLIGICVCKNILFIFKIFFCFSKDIVLWRNYYFWCFTLWKRAYSPSRFYTYTIILFLGGTFLRIFEYVFDKVLAISCITEPISFFFGQQHFSLGWGWGTYITIQ